MSVAAGEALHAVRRGELGRTLSPLSAVVSAVEISSAAILANGVQGTYLRARGVAPRRAGSPTAPATTTTSSAVL